MLMRLEHAGDGTCSTALAAPRQTQWRSMHVLRGSAGPRVPCAHVVSRLTLEMSDLETETDLLSGPHLAGAQVPADREGAGRAPLRGVAAVLAGQPSIASWSLDLSLDSKKALYASLCLS